MRDALGGTVVLVIIVFFTVVVLSYLAFNVNYTKASRMKNKIIATYEEFNGQCESNCQNKIKNYADEIGYNVGKSSLACDKNGYNYGYNNLYCYKMVEINKEVSNQTNGIVGDIKTRKYYKISTRINIELPIIQNIFSFQMFWINGDTKIFKS